MYKIPELSFRKTIHVVKHKITTRSKVYSSFAHVDTTLDFVYVLSTLVIASM